MKSIVLAGLVFLAAGLTTAAVADDKPHAYVPKDGFVPDAPTAMRIAEAVWVPIYGEAKIASERPFKATLRDGVWTVEGTLAGGKGGVAVAEIAKADARIMRVSHGK